MAYKPVKQLQFLIITLALTWQPTCLGMARLAKVPFAYYFSMGTHLYQAHYETINLAKQQHPKHKRFFLSCEDAHPDVQDFIREQLKSTKDPHLLDKLHIKKINGPSCMGVTDHGIEIRPRNHDELLRVLTKIKNNIPLTQREEDILSYHAVVAKHEFGHLKNKDLSHTRLFHPTVSITLQGLTWAFTKLCSCEKYYKPSSYTEDQWSIDIIKGGLFLAATGIAQGLIHQKLSHAYSQYKERRAQQYAMNNTIDPKKLRGYARYKERERVQRAEQIADLVVEELRKTFSENLKLKLHSHWIYHQYKKTHSVPAEDFTEFREWLIKQNNIIDKLQAMLYQTHPTHTEWIQQAEQAASKLESPSGS
jgi:hypothetical protein